MKSEIDLFISQVEKHVKEKNVTNLYKQYLEKTSVKTDVFESAINNSEMSEFIEILVPCYKLFVASQEMIDDLSVKDIAFYKGKDVDIVMGYTIYSSIYLILREYIKNDEVCERITKVFEDANLKLNVPRDTREENAEVISILRLYFCYYYIPLRLSSVELCINEYDYMVYYYHKKNLAVPKWVYEKVSVEPCLTNSEYIFEAVKNSKAKDVLSASINII